MPKVSPFHSKKSGIKVYHNNNKCTEGNKIESYNKLSSTGGLRLCDRCRELNAQDK